MFEFIKRIFRIFSSEAHSAIDQFEDPVKMTEQGIRDLKKDLDKSLKALAEVKALSSKTENSIKSLESQASGYESKAVKLLEKAKNGALDQAEADRLAGEALAKKRQLIEKVTQNKANSETFKGSVSQLEQNVNTLQSNISKYETELKSLKARKQVSEATKRINKELAGVDSSGTVAMLEEMKDKVAKEEALAQAYGEIAQSSTSLDDAIDKALGEESGATSVETDADLAALKEKLGM